MEDTYCGSSARPRSPSPCSPPCISRRSGRMVDSSVCSPGSAPPLVIAVVAAASLPPAKSTAVPAFEPAPVAARFLDAVRPVTAPADPDRDRVRRRRWTPRRSPGRCGSSPDGPISVSWDAAGRHLTISPTAHWRPDTLYTVTIDAQRALRGRRQARRPDAQRRAHRGRRARRSIAATADARRSGPADTSFTIKLDRAVPLAAVRAALRSTPRSTATCSRAPTSGEYRLHAVEHAQPAARSTAIWLDGLVDADGLPFEAVPAIVVSTGRAPSVVRFRPVNGTREGRSAPRSSPSGSRSRWTHARPPPRSSSSARGKPRHRQDRLGRGRHGARVHADEAARRTARASQMTVDGSARSRGGARVEAASATFKVVPKPAPRVRAAGAPAGGGGGGGNGGGGGGGGHIPHAGGGGAANGSWGAVERYYLRLMNCTRTGGWVTRQRHCSRPAAGTSTPLVAERGDLGPRVAPVRAPPRDQQPVRPLHRRHARATGCGTPATTSYRWAENLGCRVGQPVQRRARVAPVLPEREAVQRRPLPEPDEPRLRPGRDRRLGRQTAASGWSSTSTTPDRRTVRPTGAGRTIGRVTIGR